MDSLTGSNPGPPPGTPTQEVDARTTSSCFFHCRSVGSIASPSRTSHPIIKREPCSYNALRLQTSEASIIPHDLQILSDWRLFGEGDSWIVGYESWPHNNNTHSRVCRKVWCCRKTSLLCWLPGEKSSSSACIIDWQFLCVTVWPIKKRSPLK